MPPLTSAEDYLDLLAAIEDTAAHLEMPVVIEGYTPPYDPRMRQHQGHARPRRDRSQHSSRAQLAANWSTTPPRSTKTRGSRRLGTEKFMLDGRHTGTGGGNHFVLGGPTPADSPFLRRPDLLRSMLGYWLNHPSLSYLFSGMFIGPTSQAPRVDETRAGQPLRTGDRLRPDSRSRRGRLPAVAGGSHLPPPPGRRHRQHASRRVLHRQAVLARLAPPAASACSSCAASRCRRMRA